jgi:hypothetical protein
VLLLFEPLRLFLVTMLAKKVFQFGSDIVRKIIWDGLAAYFNGGLE